MSPAARLIVVGLALAALVGGFIAARPGDESDDQPVATSSVATPTTSASATADPTSTAPAEPAASTVPQPERVVVRGLKPVDGVKKIKVKKGDTARFIVSSDVADSAHLHGYDIEKPVGPGKPARFVFEAKIDGIYEVELENAGVPVAELRVDP